MKRLILNPIVNLQVDDLTAGENKVGQIRLELKIVIDGSYVTRQAAEFGGTHFVC